MRRSSRVIVFSVVAGLVALILACALVGFLSASRQGQRHWQIDSPLIGGHIYSAMLVPCDRFNHGQIIFGRDLMIFSRYPPPGLSIPLAPACP
ncbi:MAG: hypothetical protein HGA19_17230 [Oscillochloris sp.]|nr:hypothetical protein [Oscillochloris sp.]